MKFKERLWQLFLMIVLGVTLSVCDAGDGGDDNFDESLLTAGTAIASGSSSTSITSGENWFQIGNIQFVSGSQDISVIDVNSDKDKLVINKSFNGYFGHITGRCFKNNGDSAGFSKPMWDLKDKFTTNLYELNPSCTNKERMEYFIIGIYK